jgi:hypothetical protein
MEPKEVELPPPPFHSLNKVCKFLYKLRGRVFLSFKFLWSLVSWGNLCNISSQNRLSDGPSSSRYWLLASCCPQTEVFTQFKLGHLTRQTRTQTHCTDWDWRMDQFGHYLNNTPPNSTEDRSNIFPRNAGTCLPDYTVLQPERLQLNSHKKLRHDSPIY